MTNRRIYVINRSARPYYELDNNDKQDPFIDDHEDVCDITIVSMIFCALDDERILPLLTIAADASRRSLIISLTLKRG